MDEANPKVVFQSITIECFRAFNDVMHLPLDASAVIVSGANGRGKTSLFDAIQWLALGKIPRLEDLRSKPSEDYLKNKYAPDGSKAMVSAALRTSLGTSVVKRTGDHRSTFLEVEHSDGSTLLGNDAERWLVQQLSRSADSTDFQRSFLTAALLQQDQVRSFLSTASPAQRYETLSYLLGLGVLDDFTDAVEATEKDLREAIKSREDALGVADEEHSRAQAQLHEAEVRVETAPLVQDSVTALREIADRTGLTSWVRPDATPAQSSYEYLLRDIEQGRVSLRTMRGHLAELQQHLGRSPSTTQSDEQALANLRDQVNVLRQEVQVAASIQQAAEQDFRRTTASAEQVRRLAVAALPLLTDHCPVCSQNIRTEQVRARLEALVQTQPGLLQAQTKADDTRRLLSAKQAELTAKEASLADAEQMARQAAQWDAVTQSLLQQVGNLASRFPGWASLPNARQLRPDALRNADTWVTDLEEKLTELQEGTAATVAAVAGLTDRPLIARLKATADSRRQTLESRQKELASAAQQLADRRALTVLAREASSEVMSEAFGDLLPVLQDVFGRLSPHPTFSDLSLSNQIFRRKGTSNPLAIDSDYGVEINPSIGFSSAQANVAALCYFLALSFASSNTDFDFVLLDDPLQSMDDVNVLGFSDLCRFLRREKQLIISTHETRLGNLLRRKLVPRDESFETIILDFASWNRRGPIVNIERDGSRHEEDVLAPANAPRQKGGRADRTPH